MYYVWHRIPETDCWICSGPFNGEDARYQAGQLMALGAASVLISDNPLEIEKLKS